MIPLLHKFKSIILFCCCFGIASSAHAYVTAITTGSNDIRTDLVSFSLSGGRGVFPVSSLIGIDAFHYRNTSTTTFVTLNGPEVKSFPAAGARAAYLDGDNSLNTGIANVGSGTGLLLGVSPKATDSGLGVNFLSPVINGPGEDLIFIDMWNSRTDQSDSFVISALASGNNGDGLGFNSISSGFLNVTDYELSGSMQSTLGKEMTGPFNSLTDLESKAISANVTISTPLYIAVALDLSDMGVALGGSATGLFIQSTGSTQVDPVFIAGIPEPGTLPLLGIGLTGVLLYVGYRRGELNRS